MVSIDLSNAYFTIPVYPDCLALLTTQHVCVKNVEFIIKTLSNLGFVINYEKGQLIPKNNIKFFELHL